MAEPIQCPQCRAKLNVQEKNLGRRIRCPKCQAEFVPAPPEPAAKLVDAGIFTVLPDKSPRPVAEPVGPSAPDAAEPIPRTQTMLRSATPLAPVGGPLKIALFGPRDSGKTSLLGALVQASESQESILSARLVDKSKDQALHELKTQVYENQPEQTIEEVVTYPISFESTNGAPKLEAVVADCDGRSAGDFLSQKVALDARTDLGKVFRRADTLVLTLDAAASREKTDRDLSQFCRFLYEFEESRGKRVEVAGLAVYLVLTKCDLLARPNDTFTSWMRQIEERKRQVDARFREYLASQGRDGSLDQRSFGKLDVRVWATAVRRPALTDRPGRNQEPYGVAELFRQCLETAVAHQHRRVHASQFLVFVAAGMLAAVGILSFVAFVLFEHRPSAAVAKLENDVHMNLPRSMSRAERLKNYEEKLQKLNEFKSNPVFGQLVKEDQDDVKAYIKELGEFQQFSRDFNEKAKEPKLARNDEELQQFEEALKQMAPPEMYANQWKDAAVVRRREQYLEDVKVLRHEVDEAVKKFEDLKKKREKLEETRLTKDERRAEEGKLIAAVNKWSYFTDPTRPLPGSRSLTYADVLQFERVRPYVNDWTAWRRGRQ